MDRINKSLDEIISSSKQKNKNKIFHSNNQKNSKYKNSISSISSGRSSNLKFNSSFPLTSSTSFKSSTHSNPSIRANSSNFSNSSHSTHSTTSSSRPNLKHSVILNKKQLKDHFQVKNSVFDRLGTIKTTNNNQQINGTKITISNLNKNITSSDLAELCGSIGEVKQIEIKHDRHGISIVRDQSNRVSFFLFSPPIFNLFLSFSCFNFFFLYFIIL